MAFFQLKINFNVEILYRSIDGVKNYRTSKIYYIYICVNHIQITSECVNHLETFNIKIHAFWNRNCCPSIKHISKVKNCVSKPYMCVCFYVTAIISLMTVLNISN